VAKVNRNEPCPCGSGKKYKKCCMLEARKLASIRASNREIVQEAVHWISIKHSEALNRWVEDVWFADISKEERQGLSTADPAIRAIHDANVLEQMVAEGVFSEDGKDVPALQLILDNAEHLEDGQRAYLDQLGNNPLRLYRVVRSDPGEGFALQRYHAESQFAEDLDAYIADKWVSRMLDVGDTVGMRLMQTSGSWENTGAVYHIPDEYVGGLVDQLDAAGEGAYSQILTHYWLELVAAHV